MRALILAGGLGTRLQSVIKNFQNILPLDNQSKTSRRTAVFNVNEPQIWKSSIIFDKQIAIASDFECYKDRIIDPTANIKAIIDVIYRQSIK